MGEGENESESERDRASESESESETETAALSCFSHSLFQPRRNTRGSARARKCTQCNKETETKAEKNNLTIVL